MQKQNKKTVVLLGAIKKKRNEMISIGNSKGFTSEETVKCSKELDTLLNVYQRLILEEKAEISREASFNLQ